MNFSSKLHSFEAIPTKTWPETDHQKITDKNERKKVALV